MSEAYTSLPASSPKGTGLRPPPLGSTTMGGPNVPMKTKILSVFQSIHQIPVIVPTPSSEMGKGMGEGTGEGEEPLGPKGAIAGFRTQVVTSSTDYIGYNEPGADNQPPGTYFKME